MVLDKLDNLIEVSLKKPKKKIVVAAAGDDQVLLALKQAHELGIVEPILVGNKEKNQNYCRKD